MKIYSYNEISNELFTDSYRDCDWLDAITPSIPFNSVIVDTDLPALKAKQVLIVAGERNEKGYFTVSQNLQIIVDHRGEKHYSITEGKEIEIKDLGPLPANLAPTAPPSQFHTWDESTQSWYLSSEAEAAKVIHERERLPDITQKQLRLTLIQNGIMPDQVETKIAAIPDDDKHTRLIAQTEWQYAQSFERMSENLNMIAKELLELNDEQIDAMWQQAMQL